jgi:NAD(P)-dependent dehydrogenase (short-subunit alcohol dehydrogenase family)
MSTNLFPDIFSLEGENALITGGGTGIGFAIAEAMHAAGARVILVGRREKELREAVEKLGDRASYFPHDISESSGTPAFIKEVTGANGPITCLVNNAGIQIKKPAVDTTPEDWETMFRTHLIGAHALVRAVAPGMIERRHGSIIYTASMAALFGIPLVIAYTAAKSAMVGLVKGYSTEFAPFNVRVNSIAPGWIDTAMSRKAFEGDPGRKANVIRRTPMAKLGKPTDVGWAAVYLTSRAAEFVTGVTLAVDGGVSVGF